MSGVICENPTRLKERRLAKRVEKIWRHCAEDHLPSWAEIQNADLGDDLNFCFAVDMRLSDGFPYFIYLGDNLCRFSNIYLSGRDNCEMTLLDLATSKMDEAALSRAPVFFNDVLKLYNRRRIVYRSVLLPLSENGTDVTHIFGAANGKGV